MGGSSLPLGFVLAAFLIPALQARDLVKVTRSAPVMGATFAIELYGPEEAPLVQAGDRALDEARRVNRMLSNYLPESELSLVNRDAAKGPVRVSQELFDLLAVCQNISRQSEGAFDITVGPLMKAWGFFKDAGHLPGVRAIKDAMRSVGYQNVELDTASRSVHFKKTGVELDPGGVGKGYAVDKMAAVLRQAGIQAALISGGGSSIFGLGAPPEQNQGWPIRIADPRDEKKTAANVYLKNMSLSTSGSYEKFFWADGKVYSHIMDPRSGYPAQGMLAVSILSPQTLDSEIWAKPYFILGNAWTHVHKQASFRVLACLDRPDAACTWIP